MILYVPRHVVRVNKYLILSYLTLSYLILSYLITSSFASSHVGPNHDEHHYCIQTHTREKNLFLRRVPTANCLVCCLRLRFMVRVSTGDNASVRIRVRVIVGVRVGSG